MELMAQHQKELLLIQEQELTEKKRRLEERKKEKADEEAFEAVRRAKPAVYIPANKRSHSRWDKIGTKTFVPGVPTYIPASLSKQELDAIVLRIRIEEIGWKCNNNVVDLEHYRQRSPSPTPTYDAQGKRSNTRDLRAKQNLINERHYLIEKAVKINPQFKPPADYRTSSTKRTKKIYIPIKNYPDYNFIGLIIGPRGMTQKQMEKETGAKIAIRGRGSVKEGKGHQPGEEEDLHCLITGDTKAQITSAAKMVKKLLIPVDEGKNEHKRAQLRKLAEINGTLRDNMWQPTGRTWASADVYCKYCGEISHPTMDCPLKGKAVDKEKIESEYENFLKEIGVDGGPAVSSASRTEAEKSYEEFMNSLQPKAPVLKPSAPNMPPPHMQQGFGMQQQWGGPQQGPRPGGMPPFFQGNMGPMGPMGGPMGPMGGPGYPPQHQGQMPPQHQQPWGMQQQMPPHQQMPPQQQGPPGYGQNAPWGK
jgi:splicing factor 1